MGMQPYSSVEHNHAKIIVSVLECQLSRGDTHGEVLNHECNLGYASK